MRMSARPQALASIGALALMLPATDATAVHPPATIVAVDAPPAALSRQEAKLDAQLRRLVAPAAAVSQSSMLVPVSGAWQRGDAVDVHVQLAPAADEDDVRRRGLVPERRAGDVIEGWVRLADLAALAASDSVEALRPVRPGRVRVTADRASRANLARATGDDGAGITVGVISDGAGTLPATAVPPGCDPGSGAEGQAIAGIIATLAPGAKVLFAAGAASSLAFIDAVRCLQAAGAQVIVDDLGFFDQPFFEDGTVAQVVRAAVRAGVSYHSAAGNDAMSHYGATFRSTAGSSRHDFATTGPADNYDEIELAPGAELDCVLQWNDRFGAAADDYDLELWDLGTSPPSLATASTNRQTGTQDPYEEILAVNRGAAPARAGVAIRKVAGAVRVLGLFCFGGSTPEYVTPAGSVVGHPALAEVVTVGAVDVTNPGLDTPEPYSSRGPATIWFPVRETRAKPDMVAFDGVTDATPGFDPFFGTSAAAPDTAAVAALMLSRNACRLPVQIRDALVSTAVDIGAPGADPATGAGRVDALAAVAAVPPPTCTADAECDDGDRCSTHRCEGCSCTATPIGGFDGVACVCGHDLAAGACADVAVPRAVQTSFARGCGLVARAAVAGAERRHRLVSAAVAAFARARRVLAAGAARQTAPLACRDALRAEVDDARSRALRLRETP